MSLESITRVTSSNVAFPRTVCVSRRMTSVTGVMPLTTTFWAASTFQSGDSAVIVQGSVNGTEKKLTYEVRFPGESADNEFIPRLWATRRVGYLLDEIRLHGENAELRDEVTGLARQYGIVTPYTAYLIVEDEKQHNVPMPMRSLQGFDADAGARQEASQAWDTF